MRARALARLPAQRHTVALITGSLKLPPHLFETSPKGVQENFP